MRRFIFALFITLVSISNVYSEKPLIDIMMEKPKEYGRADFKFKVKNWYDEYNPTVINFKIYDLESSDSTFLLRAFVDDYRMEHKNGVRIPYIFSYNFGGLKPGVHKIYIELRTLDEKVATKTLEVEVD